MPSRKLGLQRHKNSRSKTRQTARAAEAGQTVARSVFSSLIPQFSLTIETTFMESRQNLFERKTQLAERTETALRSHKETKFKPRLDKVATIGTCCVGGPSTALSPRARQNSPQRKLHRTAATCGVCAAEAHSRHLRSTS